MTRLPRDYRGVGHETIGSDILSILRVVSFPEQVLGPDLAKRVAQVEPNGWYPIGMLLELMEQVEAKIGRLGLVQMGRNLFRLSHEARLKEVASCAGDVVFGIDSMYHHANRGVDIGGWKVIHFQPGLARLEKKHPTPLRDGRRYFARSAGVSGGTREREADPVFSPGRAAVCLRNSLARSRCPVVRHTPARRLIADSAVPGKICAVNSAKFSTT